MKFQPKSLLLFLVSTLCTESAAFVPAWKPSIVRLRQKDSHSQLSDVLKPSRLEIEEAAGQQKPVERIVERDAVQGFMTKTENECTKYHCMTSDPELQKTLQRITSPRAYPLFLLEKGAKALHDVMPGSSNSEGAANGAKTKERLVILGTGWGSASLLQDIDNELYDVTVISPRNFFLFTPMLAGAGVGTVDYRSIIRPIREFNRKANYLEAAAQSIDPKTRTVTCQGVQCDDVCEIAEFTVEYDRLVIAVGAKINTFGIPGVEEHCSFLKQVDDAKKIRRNIVNLFERANYPGQSDEQIRNLLTFAIIGAGPTGVELCGELRDFIEEDGPKYWKHLLKYVNIKLIEATPVVLRPFDKSLQEAAIQSLTRPARSDLSGFFEEQVTEIILDKKVEEVTENEIRLGDGTVVPYGLAVWAGGIGPLPITLQAVEAIGGLQNRAQQVARGKIAVDPWLRAVDASSEIFAIGDCVCTQGACLPATAQVAAQEGEYLAHLLNVGNLTATFESGGLLLPPQIDNERAILSDKIASFAIVSKEYMAPFQFLDMGILAYTGGSNAMAQVQLTPQEKSRIKAQGQVGFGTWRSVYLMKQASTRNRILVFIDWVKTRLFGRDISSFE